MPPESLPEALVDPELAVEQVARDRILHCLPETPVYEAARRMAERRCSSIIVEAEGEPLGIWTERDALAIDVSSPDALERPIREVMSKPVRSVTAGTGLKEVAVRFRQEGVRHYLVVDEAGNRRGVVSQSDLIANHGMVATEETLARALWLAVEVETLARQYVLTLQIGGPTLLSESQIAEVREKFAGYGLLG